jgi:hypothetical protein
VARRAKADVPILLLYAAISIAYFGWRLLPHPGRVVVATSADFQIFVWSFAWWPHALGHLTNPFVTHALYVPGGINLTWTASSPGLALALSPVTVLFGPTVAYNVAAVALPALAAWTAYLLCRHITDSVFASAIGGYLFGFSTSMLGQELAGHLHVAGVFLIPLVALVVLRRLEGGLGDRGFVWRLGVLLGAQLWISTELAFADTVMLALGLGLAAWLVRDLRPRIRASLVPIAAAYGVAALVALPFVVYALRDFHGGRIINVDVHGGTDVLNLVVPTVTNALGGSTLTGISSRFSSTTGSFYLGLPALIIVVLYAIRRWRSPGGRFLLVAAGVTSLIVLGATLVVGGHRLFPLPWRVATYLPVVRNALPFHLAAYATLAVAVIVAVWTATTPGRLYPRPYVLPLLAVVALAPALWRTSYPTFRPSHPQRFAFFTDGLYKTCLPKNGVVAVFPFGNEVDTLLWQAESGFGYRLAAGGLAPVPATGKPLTAFDSERFVKEADFRSARPTFDRLLGFAAVHGVDRVVIVPGYGWPSADDLRRIGPTELVGGVRVAPACGRPSLATRNLTRYADAYRAEASATPPNISWCILGNYFTLPQGLVPFGPQRSARIAIFVDGKGVTCNEPPAGYIQHGFATADMGVPPDTYPYFAPA